MEQIALQDGAGAADGRTLSTSYIPIPTPTSSGVHDYTNGAIQVEIGAGRSWSDASTSQQISEEWQDVYPTTQSLGSTGKGILIGMLSAFGSAALVAAIVAIVYFFRYTSRGKIFLDRISRPGEFDDEQQFLREEEDALAEMDDLQRAEYHRAKGRF